MPDPHQQIADLEADIDALSEAAERCRKIIVAARAATAAGCLLLMVVLMGLFRSEPAALVIAITAILGGIAVSGTNKSTLDEIVATVRSHEARRAEMINGLGLRTVEGDTLQ
jgi:hypothetical protein